ncbi:DUF5906 domain-containing protein [Rhizobium sp. BK418]|uniref:DUF5906 domain-containing protein n=1 Tax=Rhizobium sp. BK418 TaxID=2512120 RepID=UPI00104BFD2C|nr:DUF5906 domain-containing protein [Rhizobium sp. BK418]TCR95958.1 bifunctional DNA primase/polymerase-like protein [Rhizobium sp. BK418]
MTAIAFPHKIERLAKAGFALQWLHPKSKRPIGNDWAAKPVASLADLKRTYRDGNNVGVRLGKWSVVAGLYLHIIDFDIRVPSKVDEAREKLLELLPELDLDSVPTVISGSGGESRHFYILTDKPFPPKKFAHSDGFAMVWDESKQRDVKKWDWELHLLATGAQAAIPPSIHPDTGQPYRWLSEFDFDMLDMGIGPILPSAAVARITEDRDESEPNPERQQPLGLDEDEIIAVLDDLPAAEWFEDRDQWMRVGMALHHETDGSDFGFETWCKYSRISEKFDEKDQKRVWKSFRNRAQAPFRMASLVAVAREVRAERQLDSIEDDFDDVEEVDDSRTDMFDDLLGAGNGPERSKLSKSQLKLKKAEVEFELGRGAPPKIARMNKAHAVVRLGGRTMILNHSPGKQVSFCTVGDLHNYYENDRVPKDSTTEPVSKQWMRSKHRRSYPNGIVFAPNRQVEGAFNLWQGFSVEPDDTRSCSLFLDHLLRVVCNGNEEHFNYALNWLAHLVQRPEEKPGVAFVVKGLRGSGKDTLAAYTGEIIKAHYITVWQKDQFFGKFNAHQASCLLLHIQEGFWAGDKRDEGSLKAIITSEDAMIEPKGMNAFPVRSMLRIFISSNENWVVPASGADERRFFVLNVADHRIGDHGYFAALRAEMQSGGPAALLALLMSRDISDFQVRKVPDTQGLAEQKVEGLKNVERFWFETLESGKVDGQGNHYDLWQQGPIEVEKSAFRGNYSGWLRNRRYDGIELSEIAFTKSLKTLLPSLNTRRLRSSDRNGHFFIFPELDDCRDEFDRWIGAEIHWPDNAIDLPIDSRNTFNDDDLFN